MILTLNNKTFRGAELLVRNELRSGVYIVINDITGDYYIGKSKNISARLGKHISELKTNSESKSQSWLDEWKKYPNPENYSVFVLYESTDERLMNMVEKNLIKTLEPKYNQQGRYSKPKPKQKRNQNIQVFKDGQLINSYKTFTEIATTLFNGTRSESTTINRFCRVNHIAARGKFKGYSFKTN